MAMAMAVTPTANVFAYGETSGNSTLFSDTQKVSDYSTWKDSVWNKKDTEGTLTRKGEAYDSSKIILTPGKTAKDLGFAWYSENKGTPAVKVGKKADLSDAKVYTGTATDINRSNQKTTYKASNKVTIEGAFEENTTYYYSYTDDTKNPNWSEAQAYTTKKTSSFQTILVGDPQIGASGSQGQGTDDDINIAVDTFNWNKTLTQAKATAPNASFILSAGDQIDFSGVDSSDGKNVRESEYAGFTYPELLRNLPLATTKQYYIAERSNTQIPTFSTIDFSENSLVLRTYDYNGNKYADDYTLYKTSDNLSMKDLIAQAKNIKNDGYTDETWNKLQSEIKSAEKLMQYTGEDKGAAQLSSAYDKTNDGDNAKDMVNYYGYAQGDYKKDGTTTLKTGFSTLLDKTMDKKLIIGRLLFENQYNNILKAEAGLKKKDAGKTTTPTNTTKPAAKLTLKAGKKAVKAGQTVTLKKGKTLQLNLTINGVTGKNVKYKTSNKKIVKVTATGKLKALKKSSKKVKVTAKFGNQKISFKVKTK